jgi:EAL domain-containing protein (putative c-di-GMP-specific phosphodiesterase class I)
MTEQSSDILSILLARREGSLDALSPKRRLERILVTIRKHLGMDVGFISELADGQRFFRYVDSHHAEQPVKVDTSDPIDAAYCQRVIDGRLPELIQDATQLPEARSLPATLALPVGAHLSVPIQLQDGRIYGTLCCFSFTPDPSLNQRDLATMRAFAEIVAEQVDLDLEAQRAKEAMAARTDDALNSDVLSMVYQPIYGFSDDMVVGFEALARFAGTPFRSPDIWFGEAFEVGRGIDLEIKAIAMGLQGLQHLPDHVYVAVNAAPETILSSEFGATLSGQPLDRIVLEVTEHAVIDHYENIALAVQPLRKKGLKIAVDDAGAGYASFRHILKLAPDVIKIDMSITKNIDTDPARRALARAFIGFASETNSKIVAEGVSTEAEFSILRKLGVNKAQGYHIGKPMDIQSTVALLSA